MKIIRTKYIYTLLIILVLIPRGIFANVPTVTKEELQYKILKDKYDSILKNSNDLYRALLDYSSFLAEITRKCNSNNFKKEENELNNELYTKDIKTLSAIHSFKFDSVDFLNDELKKSLSQLRDNIETFYFHEDLCLHSQKSYKEIKDLNEKIDS